MRSDPENSGYKPEGGNSEEVIEKKVEKKELQFLVGYSSEPSIAHPDRNEDSLFIDTKRKIVGIFDGMGGYNAGDAASGTASETARETLSKTSLNKKGIESVKTELSNAIVDAHNSVLHEAQADKRKEGMGTTALLVRVLEHENGGIEAVSAHVGDCRLYRLNRIEVLTLETMDDSLITIQGGSIGEIVKRHEFLDNVETEEQITDNEEYEQLWRRKNVVTNAVGIERAFRMPNVQSFEVYAGEELLLTSDGVHDNLTRLEIEEVMRMETSPEVKAKELVRKAKKVSADETNFRHKPDDITAVVIRV